MGIRQFLVSLLKLFVLLVGGEWFFYVGVRLYLNELLAVTFIAFCLIFSRIAFSAPIPKNVNAFIKTLVASLMFAALTGFLIPWGPVSDIPDSAIYYVKAITQLFLHTTFIICAVRFMLSLEPCEVKEVLNCYIIGAIACTAYGVVQGVTYSFFHIDLDSYIWRFFLVDWDAATGIDRYAWGTFYRIKGWTQEPNVLASYIASVFPIILLSELRYKWVSGVLLSAGILLAQSLSGIGGLVISFIVLVRRQTTVLRIFLPAGIILASSLVMFWYVYPEEVENYITVKLDPYGTRLAHVDLVQDAFESFLDNPVGYGFGTSSQVIEVRTSVPGYNYHSSWMTLLVEQGPIGLALNLLLVLIVLVPLLKINNAHLNACGAGYLAILVGAVFYNTLSIMYAQFYPALILVLYESQKHLAPSAKSQR